MPRWQDRLGTASGALALILMLVAGSPAVAATAGSQPAPAQSDEVRALVAPVALYPDPILALVLQASTLPVQVVEAERFLGKRQKDKTLAPDADWDKSIIALLNYPRQVQLMSEYLDWTQDLGDSVVDDLDGVQAAVQDVRLAAYDAGFLKSDKHQKVEVVDDQVRITSTDPDKVSIPSYDPTALLDALDANDAEDQADVAPAPPGPPPNAPKQAAPAAQPAPESQATEAPGAPAAAPAAESVAAAPAAVPAVAAAPPVITYGPPENTFWSSAATFAGGAVVGGLLGWGSLKRSTTTTTITTITTGTTTGTTTISRMRCASGASPATSGGTTCSRRRASVRTRDRRWRRSGSRAGRRWPAGGRASAIGGRRHARGRETSAGPIATSGRRSTRAVASSIGQRAARAARTGRHRRGNNSISDRRPQAAGPGRLPPGCRGRRERRRGRSERRSGEPARSGCRTPASRRPARAASAGRAAKREPPRGRPAVPPPGRRPPGRQRPGSGPRPRPVTRGRASIRGLPLAMATGARSTPMPAAAHKAAISAPPAIDRRPRFALRRRSVAAAAASLPITAAALLSAPTADGATAAGRPMPGVEDDVAADPTNAGCAVALETRG